MKPYPYQELTLQRNRNKSKLALFWKMRLGKSPTSLWWLWQKDPQPERTLIICPKSVINSWIDELHKHDKVALIFSTKNRDMHELWATFPGYFITNYECIIANDVFIHEMPWDAIILDESVKIQSPKALSSIRITDTDAFTLNSERFPQWQSKLEKQYRAILCGTPAPESELQYFQQFKFLYGKMGYFRRFEHYRKKGFQTSWEKPGKYIVKDKFYPVLAEYIDTYAEVLNRQQVGMELPNVYEKEFVEMAPKDKKIYDEFEENWFVDFMQHLLEHLGESNQSIKQLETRFATVAQNYLHQLACGFPKQAEHIAFMHKMNRLNELVTGELKNEKLVVWCHYRRDIKEIRNRLKTSCTHIWGSMDLHEERKNLDAFRKGNTKVLICQIAKASMGMDLSIADTQVFFSRSWSALQNEQATDRLIHPDKIRQKLVQSLLTIDLIAQETVDEDLHHVLIEKKGNSSVWKLFLDRTKFDASKLHLETADI